MGLVHIVCPGCDAVNRAPSDKCAGEGKCGRCHKQLFNGMPIELNAGRFLRHLQHSSIPLLVDFWAEWCGPCKMFAPVFIQAVRKLQPAVRLVKVNTEAEQALAAKYNIMSIPTLVLFKNGQEANRIAGAMDLQRLLAWVHQHI